MQVGRHFAGAIGLHHGPGGAQDGLLMYYVVGEPVSIALAAITAWRKGLQGSNAILLGLLLGSMMACELRVPNGGVFVLPIPNAVTNLGAYLLAIVVVTVVSAIALAALKRPIDETVLA